MKECAFCSHTGKLSAEHIVSAWMKPLFPGPVKARYGSGDEFIRDSMDWKAKVVCETCNNTWMSKIESEHAKPVLTPLLTGETDVPIGLAEAHSMALFAFKTAVVLDHAGRDREPFFSRRVRYAFRERQAIPSFVQMWFTAFAGHRGNGRVLSMYHEGTDADGYRLQMYCCTCAFGHLVLQVLAVKQIGSLAFRSLTPFRPELAIPFWPRLPRGPLWPPPLALRTQDDFTAFAGRWQNIEVADSF
jgi:hypothetical protein